MNIIAKKNFWLIFSASTLAISVALIIIFRLQFGMDFTGGTLLEIKTQNNIQITQVREGIDKFYSKETIVQDSGKNQFIIRNKINSESDYNAFQSNLQKAFPNISILRHESIGSTVGSDLAKKAIEAIIIASILIVVYIAYAFRQVPRTVSAWSFGTVAIVTLLHDLASSIAIFFIVGKIFGYEIDSSTVVAALTILGFSTHDTIVVFDRIRENVIKNPQKSFAENANSSINQTIARSLNTSLTAILVLVAMLVLGGSTIKPFIFLLATGIAIGTYSSIFVASPLLVTWFERQNKKNG